MLARHGLHCLTRQPDTPRHSLAFQSALLVLPSLAVSLYAPAGQVLIVSDEHPNVVRCFAMEEDREFVYLALERCRSTLADALAAPQVGNTAGQ
jgi:hypothetical protein